MNCAAKFCGTPIIRSIHIESMTWWRFSREYFARRPNAALVINKLLGKSQMNFHKFSKHEMIAWRRSFDIVLRFAFVLQQSLAIALSKVLNLKSSKKFGFRKVNQEKLNEENYELYTKNTWKISNFNHLPIGLILTKQDLKISRWKNPSLLKYLMEKTKKWVSF